MKHNTQSGRKPFSIEDYYKSQVEPSDWRLCLHKGIVNKQFHLLIMSLGLESLRLLSLFPLLITHTHPKRTLWWFIFVFLFFITLENCR